MAERSDEGFFAGVTLEEIEVLGRPVTVPIRYFDVARMSAAFPANAAKIQEVLPSDKLKLVQPKPGVAVVAIGAWEYGRIDGLAPYNELAIVVPVLYERTGGVPGLPGFYVLHLPVTTEEARLLGVEIWGLRPGSRACFIFRANVCRCSRFAPCICTIARPQAEALV